MPRTLCLLPGCFTSYKDTPLTLTLEITGLSNDGRGIARRAGEKIVFVSHALPGETVTASITCEKKAFVEACATEIIRPAENAAEAVCPHAGECGGCPLMRMSYKDQLFWKQRFVYDALSRTGGIASPAVHDIVPSPLTEGFRNRVELAFAKDSEGNIRLGMRRRTTHSVIPTPHCALMTDTARAVLGTVEDCLKKSGLSVYKGPASTGRKKMAPRETDSSRGYLRFCQIRTGRVPDAACLASCDAIPEKEGIWVILLTSPGTAAENACLRSVAEHILEASPAVHAVVHEQRAGSDMLTAGEKRLFVLGRPGSAADPSWMLMPLDNKGYLIDCADFFQVNTACAHLLARTASSLCHECESLTDLYCGSGAPGLNIARKAVLGIEYSKSAIASAQKNALRFNVQGKYRAGDASSILSDPDFGKAAAPLVLCDPPRAGLSDAVIRYLLRGKAGQILYISCNPVTMARDIKALSPAYAPASITPVDLFPHTPHVETVVLLSKG